MQYYVSSDFFRYKTDSGFRSRSQWQKVSVFPKFRVQNSQSEKDSQTGSHLQPKFIHVLLKAPISH